MSHSSHASHWACSYTCAVVDASASHPHQSSSTLSGPAWRPYSCSSPVLPRFPRSPSTRITPCQPHTNRTPITLAPRQVAWTSPPRRCPQTVLRGIKIWKNLWCQTVTPRSVQWRVHTVAMSMPRIVRVVVVESGTGTLSSKRRAARGVAGRRAHQHLPLGPVLPITSDHTISTNCRPKIHTPAFRRWVCHRHRYLGSIVSHIRMILLHPPHYIVGRLYVPNAVRIMNVSGRNVNLEDGERPIILLDPSRNRATVCDSTCFDSLYGIYFAMRDRKSVV